MKTVCLGVWLQLLFKKLFVLKCIKMMFFNFLKLILKSVYQNDPKNIKTKLIFYKKINK